MTNFLFFEFVSDLFQALDVTGSGSSSAAFTVYLPPSVKLLDRLERSSRIISRDVFSVRIVLTLLFRAHNEKKGTGHFRGQAAKPMNLQYPVV